MQRFDVAIEYVLCDYPDTPDGHLTEHLKATIAEYEREKVTERMSRGRRQKVKNGHVVARGRVVYGYRPAAVDGTATSGVDQEEARVVRMIYGWYTGRGEHGALSARAIARKLYGMRVPTYGDKHPGKTRRKREPYRRSNAAVRKVLINETYAGVWRYAGMAVQVPPIIDRETWEDVQRHRERDRAQAKRSRKREYLRASHMKRDRCGSAMTGQTVTVDGATYGYYICAARRQPLDYGRRCATRHFRVDCVDAAVRDWVRSFIAEPETAAVAVGKMRERGEAAMAPLREQHAVVGPVFVWNGRHLLRMSMQAHNSRADVDVLIYGLEALLPAA